MNSAQQFQKDMESIQSCLLSYIEEDDNADTNLYNLKQLIDKLRYQEDSHKFKSILHLITSISNNYHRNSDFFTKIESIIKLYINEIKAFYLNTEIFDIFKSNKRLLLFLIKENIITVDNYFFRTIISPKYEDRKYPEYFLPEIKQFLTNEFVQYYYQKREKNDKEKYEYGYIEEEEDLIESDWIQNINEEIPENFELRRTIGENDTNLCILIRKDLITEFVKYCTQSNARLNSFIVPSIFETNSFLLKRKRTTLIEYAAFFGSIQILKYLNLNGVELTPSLWIYAIHSNNAEVIHFLEENGVDHVLKELENDVSNNRYINYDEIKEKDEIECNILNESIKCHHSDLYNYFLNNLYQNDKINEHDSFIQSLKFYNFALIQCELINKSEFVNFCEYDYPYLVEMFLQNGDIDLKQPLICKKIIISNIIIQFKIFIQYNLKSYFSNQIKKFRFSIGFSLK